MTNLIRIITVIGLFISSCSDDSKTSAGSNEGEPTAISEDDSSIEPSEDDKEKGSGKNITEEDEGDASSKGKDSPQGPFPSILDLGAVGDGTTDDSAVFQLAVQENRQIYIPATEKGYLIKSPIVIDRPVLIEGEDSLILAQSDRLFDIKSGDIRIEKLKIQALRSAQATIFYLNTTAQGLEKIHLEDNEIYDAMHGIKDAASGTNKIVNFYVEDTIFWHGQSTQISLSDGFAYLFFKNITFDFTRIPEFEVAFPIFDMKNNEGSIFEDVHINANGVIPEERTSVGISISDSKAVWLTRTMVDTTGGYGFVFSNVEYIYLTDTVASLNARDGFYFSGCKYVTAINVVAAGRYTTPLTVIPNAHGWRIEDSHNIQLTNFSGRYHTGHPIFIDALSSSLQGNNLMYLENQENTLYTDGESF